jgi:hypothetical protein
MENQNQHPFKLVVRPDSQNSKRYRWEVYCNGQREFSFNSFASQDEANSAGYEKMNELIATWRVGK